MAVNAEEKEDVLGNIDDLGLKITKGEVEVGGTYPLFGMITAIEELEDGSIVAEINHNIKANMIISDKSRVDILRARAFETGIFVSTVISKEPSLVVDCQAVIYGKPQAHNA